MSFRICVDNNKGSNNSNANRNRSQRYPSGGKGGDSIDNPIFTTVYGVPHNMAATITATYAEKRLSMGIHIRKEHIAKP